jgi:neutral ceramidase
MRRLVLPMLLLLLCAAPAAAKTPVLRAGAGQADITPPRTGYYLGGWTRADRLALGQSTRLYANALVLQRGKQKLALVAAELFAIPAGLQEDVAKKLADLGFDRTSVLLAASHTHSAPGGFTNDPVYNSAAPSSETIEDPSSFINFFATPPPADRQLYTFLVNQIAASVRRADADRARAVAGWGHATLSDLTQNRSLFAFLRNYGITVPDGMATPDMDPKGPEDTIDTNVDVLRVDKLVHGRHVPIGAYSNFADHGTVVHSETQAYSGDHHASAWRLFADRVRKYAKVPNRQTVVNVYPNGAEGDMTAGIEHVGVKAAMFVGGREAAAMFAGWRDARRHLSARPVLDWRWTRACWCGRDTATGKVDTEGHIGIPFFTGSDEGRGPLYDLDHTSMEGTTSPVDDPIQGDKVYIQGVGPNQPAAPYGVYRIADGAIATVPGEPTKQEGVNIRAGVLAAFAGTGVTHAIIGGLAFDYINYVTTPAEYEAQSYEGGSTLYGKNEGTFVVERLAELAAAIKAGKQAPDVYPMDVAFGVTPDGPAYPPGADHGTLTAQPASAVKRGSDVVKLAWTGGANGTDRPVDRAFIRAERRVGKRWRVVDSDLNLYMLWRVDDQGHYTLEWEPPATIPRGTYRLHVTATRYELISDRFKVS